jgi:DNA-binding beta-propeller fold protein YncE
VAVDGAGNVYIAIPGHNAIKEWTAANNIVTTLVSSGLSIPYGVAVDGAGNVYIADTGHNAIKEVDGGQQQRDHAGLLGTERATQWRGGGRRRAMFTSPTPADNAIKELPHAFVDPTDRLESLAAGSDAIIVLPATANLLAPFTPTSEPSWLTISGITNGVVSFTFHCDCTCQPHGPSSPCSAKPFPSHRAVQVIPLVPPRCWRDRRREATASF